MATIVATPKDLLELVGRPLGTSSWLEVPQKDVNAFAKATRDEQWIHVDVERAKRGPFGGTIVHGYMTLALVIPLFWDLLVVEQQSMAVNYGVNKVRFPAPAPVGSRLRLTGVLTDAEEVKGGVHILVDCTIEREGGTKPVCVAQIALRFYE